MTEKEIAKITEAYLGWEDHGYFAAGLQFTYGSAAQGSGLYALDEWDESEGERVGKGSGIDLIRGIIDACGVRSWDKLVGRTVYVTRDRGKIIGIAPLPTEQGREFYFAQAFERDGALT